MIRRLSVLIALSLASACGGLESDAEVDESGETTSSDLGAAQSEEALRGAYDFRCTASAAVTQQGTLPSVGYVRIHAAQLILSPNTRLTAASTGTYDPAYSRQPTKARFRHFSGTGPFETPVAALVPKAMRTGTLDFKKGGRGGWISLQYNTGDAFGSVGYFCKRIAAL